MLSLCRWKFLTSAFGSFCGFFASFFAVSLMTCTLLDAKLLNEVNKKHTSLIHMSRSSTEATPMVLPVLLVLPLCVSRVAEFVLALIAVFLVIALFLVVALTLFPSLRIWIFVDRG
jgi:hypothetical protein